MNKTISTTRRTMLLGAAALANLTWPALAADSIKIGMLSALTGVGAESGRNQRNGAQLALDAINAKGGVLGRKLELVVEDDQTSNPGSVLAFGRLTSQSDIVAYMGSPHGLLKIAP